MIRLLSANQIRLRKSKLFWIGMFATIGYCVFLLIVNYIEKVSYIGNSIVQLNWYLLSPFSVVSFFCPLFCSIFIGTEYSDGTMRNRLIVGHTRSKIYFAIFATVCVANILITLIASTVIIVLGRLLIGWSIINPPLLILHYIGGMMMLVASAGLYTLLAMAIHNKGISVATSIVTFLVSYGLSCVVQRLVYGLRNGEALSDILGFLSEGMISQPVLEFIYDLFPSGQTLQYSGNIILHPIRLPLCALAFCLVTILCGLAIFNKRDMK